MNNERINEENWITKELEELNKTSNGIEILPGFILEENKPIKIIIEFNFNEPFKKWTDPQNGKVKSIINLFNPLNNRRESWFINNKNPILKEILTELSAGNNTLTVMQIGNKDKTRYILVK